MLPAFAKLLILTALAMADSQSRHPDAVEVFNCDFGRAWDVNYDDWPDKWQRLFGRGLPHYVKAIIEPDPTAVSGNALVIRLNGGGAHIQSPCASVSNNFSYKVEARLKVSDSRRARAQLRLEFCDEQKQVLETAASDWIAAPTGWTNVYIGPVNVSDPRIRLARVAIFVEAGDHADLNGKVALESVWMGRLPKMAVRTNSPFNVYTDKDDIEITCDLSGILDSDPDILFELLDASSQRLDGNRVQLEGRLIDVQRSKASEILNSEADDRAAYAGITTWRPPIKRDGFYRVSVKMETAEGMLKRDVINLALAPTLERPAHGEFGWSLAGDEIPLEFDALAQLLPRVAVNWVKLPVWYSPAEPERGDQFAFLVEKLAAKDIEVVGVVDRPPADSELAAQLSPEAVIADTISHDSSTWMPLLDPVLTRLSLRIRWWQLGADYDSSLSIMPDAVREIAKLREKLFRFGQDVNLGVGWTWNHLSPDSEPPSWQFQQFSASPALTSAELGQYLELPRQPGVGRWVLVEPLSRSEYDLETRARDLVEQMIAAKIHRADAIFVVHPFDDERGLMTDGGAPSELLLPWRTAASLLSGAKYLGSVPLPNGSQNRLFETAAGETLMVIWNDSPVQEAFELGDSVRVLDVWGRQHDPIVQPEHQLIEVTRLPRFVLGLNPHIAHWRMTARFARKHVPSIFGQNHANTLQIENSFPQGVGGSVELVVPEGWQISPSRIDFKLAAGEAVATPFDVTLPFDARSGPASVRADFIVEADREYRFSLYRELVVGDGMVEIETNSRLEEDGTLVIEQRMANHGDELVDFKCLLYAPGNRRRQRTQVFRLGSSPDVKIYRYPNGEELLGAEFWLRAQEVDGGRVLNHRFVVEQ